MLVLTHDCNVIKSQRRHSLVFKYYYTNLPPNNSQKDVFKELIHTLKLSQIHIKLTMICSWAKYLFYLHLPLILLEDFFNAKMQLKIYHLLIPLLHIIIYFDIFSLFLIVIDLFYFVNILHCYSSCLLQLLILAY